LSRDSTRASWKFTSKVKKAQSCRPTGTRNVSLPSSLDSSPIQTRSKRMFASSTARNNRSGPPSNRLRWVWLPSSSLSSFADAFHWARASVSHRSQTRAKMSLKASSHPWE
jgi:hypothetical protein